MKLKEWKDRFFRWLDGEYDVMENIMDGSLEPDEGHEKRKHVIKEEHEKMKASGISQTVISMERKGFYQIYLAVAIVSCNDGLRPVIMKLEATDEEAKIEYTPIER